MRRVTIRGLLARKLRSALTALAIVLGVTFVTGTLVLGDTLNRTFDSADRHRLPARQLPDPRQGGVQRHRRQGIDSTANRKAVPAVDRRRRASPARSRVRATDRSSGYAQFIGARRQRDRQRRRLDPRVLVRPQPTAVPLGWSRGRAPSAARRGRDGQGDGDEVPLRRRRHGCASCSRTAAADVHDHGNRDVRQRQQPGRGDAGRLRPADGAGACSTRAARYDTINVLAAPGADNVALQRAIARVLPPGVRGGQRPDRRQRALERGQQRRSRSSPRRC